MNLTSGSQEHISKVYNSSACQNELNLGHTLSYNSGIIDLLLFSIKINEMHV